MSLGKIPISQSMEPIHLHLFSKDVFAVNTKLGILK